MHRNAPQKGMIVIGSKLELLMLIASSPEL